MKSYFVHSVKYNIQERETKRNGTVYDVYFYVAPKKDDGTPGREIQKKLSGFPTKAAAKKAYSDFIVENCDSATKADKPKKQKLIFGDLVEQYLSAIRAECKDSTVYDRRHIFDRYILPKYKDIDINDLTKIDLYHWQTEIFVMRNERNGKEYSYDHRIKIRRHFNTFLTWCENVYDVENKLRQVKPPKKRTPKTQMQIWTQDEFCKFIDFVSDPMYRCLFSLLYYTGRRKCEVLALHKTDVGRDTISFTKSVTKKTLDGSTYQITSTKAEKTKKAYICPAAQKALAEYEGAEPFFFGGEKPLPETSVTRVFDAAIKASGVKRIRMHDLRHSFVSLLIHNGANIAVVADLISDTIEQVTKTYTHMWDEDERTVLSRIT